MPDKKTFVEHSKDSWVTGDLQPDKPNLEQIQLGCLQRIATGVETMAKSYTNLQEDRDWYKRRLEQARTDIEKLQRRINSYKGHRTRRRNERTNN